MNSYAILAMPGPAHPSHPIPPLIDEPDSTVQPQPPQPPDPIHPPGKPVIEPPSGPKPPVYADIGRVRSRLKKMRASALRCSGAAGRRPESKDH